MPALETEPYRAPNDKTVAPGQHPGVGVAGRPGDVGIDGIEGINAQATAGGLAGLINLKDNYQIYTPLRFLDPMYQQNRSETLRLSNNAMTRPFMNTGPNGVKAMDSTQQNQFREGQMALMQQLQARAAGTAGPSPAELQLKRASDQNMNNALSLALTARGGSNQIAALRSAQDQRAQMQQGANMQAAELRANEQTAAQQQLGQVLQSGRGADIGVAQGNAQLAQQNQFANLNSAVQQQAQKDDMVKFFTQQGYSLDQANLMTQIQQAQMTAGTLNQAVAASHGVSTQNSAQGVQLAGAGLSALGAMAAMSDEREKTDITDGSADLAEFLTSIGTHKYKYKDPDKPLRGRGEFVSPMAQELEQTKLGKHMVHETDDGKKVVDYGKGFGAVMAALSMHQKRLDAMEAR